MISDGCPSPKLTLPLSRPATRKQVVNKHGSVRNETIIADGNKLANERVRLNSTSPADDDFSLNLDEWANEAIVADCTPVKVYWFYHRHSFSKHHVANASTA